MTPLPLGANISFADSGLTDRQQITESTVLAGGYVAAYATSSRYLEARNSNQTIVLFFISASIPRFICCSVLVSTDEVASSRMSIGALDSAALAIFNS